MGKLAEAIAACQLVAAQRPNSLNGYLMLFDLNLQAGDERGINDALHEVERIEGPEGAYRVANKQAVRLLRSIDG
jgi:hypothetical protein